MRTAKVNRKTKETDISCEINIDGTGQNEISTGVGFFDHMLEIFSHHSLIDLKLKVWTELPKAPPRTSSSAGTIGSKLHVLFKNPSV